MYNEKLVDIPGRVDIFDLSAVPSMEYLYKYVEIVSGILLPPLILILRFTEMTELKDYEMDMLRKGIQKLQDSGIIVVLSDIGLKLRAQINAASIERKVGNNNIFTNIKDAAERARTLKAINAKNKI